MVKEFRWNIELLFENSYDTGEGVRIPRYFSFLSISIPSISKKTLWYNFDNINYPLTVISLGKLIQIKFGKRIEWVTAKYIKKGSDYGKIVYSR